MSYTSQNSDGMEDLISESQKVIQPQSARKRWNETTDVSDDDDEELAPAKKPRELSQSSNDGEVWHWVESQASISQSQSGTEASARTDASQKEHPSSPDMFLASDGSVEEENVHLDRGQVRTWVRQAQTVRPNARGQ
eukprot:scpid104640/ scgid6606/ 